MARFADAAALTGKLQLDLELTSKSGKAVNMGALQFDLTNKTTSARSILMPAFTAWYAGGWILNVDGTYTTEVNNDDLGTSTTTTMTSGNFVFNANGTVVGKRGLQLPGFSRVVPAFGTSTPLTALSSSVGTCNCASQRCAVKPVWQSATSPALRLPHPC